MGWTALLYLGVLITSDAALPENVVVNGTRLELLDESRISLRPVRLRDEAAAISVDGRLDEPAWDIPPINGPLRVIEPDTLKAPPYRTDLRLFYTEHGLYLSVDMEQPAETLVERHTVRDGGATRDMVNFSLDTSGTGLYGYWMDLALGDSIADGTLLPERQYNPEWDGAWKGATRRTESGWSAEVFVPWSQLSMPKTRHTRQIGVYFSRKLAHLDELWAWPGLPKSQPRFMSILPQLELVGIDPRQQWSLFPFASSTFDAGDNRLQYRAGLDAFWRPSSNFQLTATANPDFGSVESDDVVVNLTADETFFPEKRLFFLEGQDIFNTTPRSTADSQRFTVVNTRRIGGRPRRPNIPGLSLPLRQAVEPSDLLGATKVTGQAGAFRYGVLAAVEDDTLFVTGGNEYLQAGREFGALRLIYEDNRGAAYRGLGIISTLVSHPDSDAIVHAADFHYLSKEARWSVDGQILMSDREESGIGYGGHADISYSPRQGIKHTLGLTALDETLNVNDLGYQRRNNMREAWLQTEWVRSDLVRIRDFAIKPFVLLEINGDGERTNNTIASEFTLTFNHLDQIDLFVAHFPKQFDDRNSFGNGTFAIAERQQMSVRYRTNTANPLSIFGKSGYRGEFVGGETYELAVGFTWRPRNSFSMNVSTSWFDRKGWLLHQEDRRFSAFEARQWQPSLRAEYFLSAKQHFSLALQWVGIRARERARYVLPEDSTRLVPDARSAGAAADFGLSHLAFQLRYRWQIAPLSDLFIVYSKGDSQRRVLSPISDLFRQSWDDPLSEQLIIKLRYRLGS